MEFTLMFFGLILAAVTLLAFLDWLGERQERRRRQSAADHPHKSA